jgi:two-component system sensor histidine kinase YesM
METVRYQIKEDPDTASEMLQSFAHLMRYSINSGHTKVALETDVEYVNDYLLLQKVRYNNCLRYEFRIPDDLLECQVPKLMLQPLVENSIKHGYRQGQVLHILVEVRQTEGDLLFTVRDNGTGIEPGRLEAIRESFGLELNSPVITHIGLYNLHKVLGLLYGPGYGIHIESTLGQGTTVTLNVPYEMEEEVC